MPLPRALLDDLQSLEIIVETQQRTLHVPPAGAAERPPLPLSLQPETWVLSECEGLRRALNQAGIAWFPARLRSGQGDDRPALALLGVDRARAMKLAYKRRQPAILGLRPGRVDVVFTGVTMAKARGERPT